MANLTFLIIKEMNVYWDYHQDKAGTGRYEKVN